MAKIQFCQKIRGPLKRSQLIIITDLDGTLLDQDTYSYEVSLPAIQRLISLHIPLVLCSSKTSSEIIALWEELGLKDPFISENGGAIYILPNTFSFPIESVKSKGPLEALELGTEVSALRHLLNEAVHECKVKISSFGTMSVEEVCTLTGLSRDQAALALRREYNEPFLVNEGDQEKLFGALRKRGLMVSQGGRFFHLSGGHDKGKALRILLDLYRQSDPEIISIGLGNSANDLPLLSQVNQGILVKNADGSYDPEILKIIPDIKRTQEVGPRGWNEAIENLLAGPP